MAKRTFFYFLFAAICVKLSFGFFKPIWKTYLRMKKCHNFDLVGSLLNLTTNLMKKDGFQEKKEIGVFTVQHSFPTLLTKVTTLQYESNRLLVTKLGLMKRWWRISVLRWRWITYRRPIMFLSFIFKPYTREHDVHTLLFVPFDSSLCRIYFDESRWGKKNYRVSKRNCQQCWWKSDNTFDLETQSNLFRSTNQPPFVKRW